MKTYLNLDGVECVIIINADGSTWSGLKSAYDEMLKQTEQSTPSLAVDAKEL
jgi:hypothetical protein